MPDEKLTRDQIANAYRAERRAIAQLVGSMSDFHWEKESRCDRWTNGEVAAHLTIGDGIPWPVLLSMLTEVGINHGVEALQSRWATKGRQYVLDRLQKEEVTASVRWGFGQWPFIGLAEIVIHGEDIRRSAEMPRTRPPSPRLMAEILKHMGGRLREIGAPGLISLTAGDDYEAVYELNGKGGVKRRTDVDEAPVNIVGEPLEQILRLSGREARLSVRGEGPLADAANTWATSRSDSARLFFWR